MATPAPTKKLPWAKLVAGTLVAIVAGVLVLRGLDYKYWIAEGLRVIQSAGPAAFFIAMALLPAVGVPSMLFTLTAGPAFAASLGTALVVFLSVAAIVVNLCLSYFLARRALRPVLERLFTRLGYRLPQVEAGDVTDLIVICRVTPGVPFFVQNYLLGLANVPFGKYFVISTIVSGAYTAAFVVFGEALLAGRGRVVLVSLGALVALTAVTHLLRRHYGRRKAPVQP